MDLNKGKESNANYKQVSKCFKNPLYLIDSTDGSVHFKELESYRIYQMTTKLNQKSKPNLNVKNIQMSTK